MNDLELCATLRALREDTGLSQPQLAVVLTAWYAREGVDRTVGKTMVEHWEHEKYARFTPAVEVVEFVRELRDGQRKTARRLAERIMTDVEAGRRDAPVMLPYYRSQAQYDRARDDGRVFTLVNTVMRLTADLLEMDGVACVFRYPREDV